MPTLKVDWSLSWRKGTAHTSIKEIETRTEEFSFVMKHAATYRQLKPVYDRYRQFRDK